MHITWTDRQYAAKPYHQRKVQIVGLDLNPLSLPLVYPYWRSFRITVAAQTKWNIQDCISPNLFRYLYTFSHFTQMLFVAASELVIS
ncbi:unnamed protein product [Acanthoscelides obtectus]|uniref:Uncharacterized protein n=1 Tax=Acanthoscelides obtectus TaxID=200917 RepID=A0A9P0M2N1_ACAOB|nr:unnamed protein product [Acanthoscelides obtectus]CAK1633366.1 hypothetical protein AOBTE_LOCUS8077 [Acanthoscelides obtectus]